MSRPRIHADGAARSRAYRERKRVAAVALAATRNDRDSWGTPSWLVALARQVLGAIDIDPASNEFAQRTVAASTYYDKNSNGLEHPWPGRAWCNPPYSKGLIARFVDKLLEEYESGRTTAAILLVNNATDSAWFHRLIARCSAWCLMRGRVHFEHPALGTGPARQGQVIFYFGADVATFERIFGAVGLVVRA